MVADFAFQCLSNIGRFLLNRDIATGSRGESVLLKTLEPDCHSQTGTAEMEGHTVIPVAKLRRDMLRVSLFWILFFFPTKTRVYFISPSLGGNMA